MESKDRDESENPLLVVEDAESGSKLVGPTVIQDAVNWTDSPRSFKRWAGLFRPKKFPQPQRYVEDWPEDSQYNQTLSPCLAIQEQQWERMSGYSSQLGTVKTTSLSVESQSAVRSRGTTQSTVNQRSSSENRRSTEMESLKPACSPSSVDEEAHERATQRCRVIQEILATESDYVSGLKALAGVLSMFSMRSAIYHNVQRLREVHEFFLVQLQNVIPPKSAAADAELSSLISGSLSKRSGVSLKALQNRSLRTRKFRQKYDIRIKLVNADPAEARDIAREIEKMSVSSSGAYESFCKTYVLLKEDVGLLRQSTSSWSTFNQGIEALSKSVAPMETRGQGEKKSMTVDDLLIKPMQRICKYGLLLDQLSKWTPNRDCLSSSNEIKQISDKIKHWAGTMNNVTDEAYRSCRVPKTLSLQSKLEFPGSGTLRNVYEQLGPMIMCGVIHVTYQLPKHISGAYMVCALFDHYFLLAKPSYDGKLQVVACVYVWDIKLDTLRNGKGLCCSGCLFSWKLAFQHLDDNFELVLSASTAAEEKQWTSEIMKSANRMEPMPIEPRKYSILSLAIVPFEHSAALPARTASVHYLSTSRTASLLQHVVIQKTHHPCSWNGAIIPVEGDLERPTDFFPEGTALLVTRRLDRIHLEQSISEAYTSDMLPYPGMVLGTEDKRLMGRLSTHAKRLARRSTSSNILNGRTAETVAHPMQSYHDTSAESMEDSRYEVPEDTFPYDDGNHVVVLKGSSGGQPQNEAVKFRGVSKETSNSHAWSGSQGSRSYRRFGNLSWKISVNSFLNSISTKRLRGSRTELSCET